MPEGARFFDGLRLIKDHYARYAEQEFLMQTYLKSVLSDWCGNDERVLAWQRELAQSRATFFAHTYLAVPAWERWHWRLPGGARVGTPRLGYWVLGSCAWV